MKINDEVRGKLYVIFESSGADLKFDIVETRRNKSARRQRELI